MENYFRNFHDRNFSLFFVVTFALSLAPMLVLLPFFDAPDLKNGQMAILGESFPLFVILIIPAVETLIFQSFPVFLLDIFPARSAVRLGMVSLPFALGHIVPNLLFPSLINGITGGVILGLFYLICRHRSHYHAMVATFAIHASHNATALGLGG